MKVKVRDSYESYSTIAEDKGSMDDYSTTTYESFTSNALQYFSANTFDLLGRVVSRLALT